MIKILGSSINCYLIGYWFKHKMLINEISSLLEMRDWISIIRLQGVFAKGPYRESITARKLCSMSNSKLSRNQTKRALILSNWSEFYEAISLPSLAVLLFCLKQCWIRDTFNHYTAIPQNIDSMDKLMHLERGLQIHHSFQTIHHWVYFDTLKIIQINSLNTQTQHWSRLNFSLPNKVEKNPVAYFRVHLKFKIALFYLNFGESFRASLKSMLGFIAAFLLLRPCANLYDMALRPSCCCKSATALLGHRLTPEFIGLQSGLKIMAQKHHPRTWQ